MSDRGMMKWNAFNAILSHGASVQELMYERNKTARPILTEDALEELNLNLETALRDESEVVLIHYHKGYLYEEEGLISKVDPYEKTIHINNRIFSIYNVIKIEIK